MKKSPRFTSVELERVAAAVSKAEATTSGEIVPVILPTSQDYGWLPATVGLRVALLTLGFVEVLNLFAWPLSWPNTFGLVATTTLISMGLASMRPIARRLLGTARLHAGVLDRTRSLFITEGVTETRDRTGVLIFISRFEREISILADRGIHQKLPAEFWDSLCREFATSVADREEITGLCKIIERVGAELSRFFPRSVDDRNELSDGLREKESR